MTKLNFSLSEMIKSDKAIENNINNMPTIQALDNLLYVICFLQDVRNHYNKPVIVTSGYRCEKVNQLVGGAKNSYHIKGLAADFKVKGVTNKEVWQYIHNNMAGRFVELILEKTWIHVAVKV